MNPASKSTSCQRSPRSSDARSPPSAETIRCGLKSSSAASIRARIASFEGTGAMWSMRLDLITRTPCAAWARDR